MALPRQVEAQLRELEEIEKQLTAAKDDFAGNTDASEGAAAEQPEVAPAPEPQKREAAPEKPVETTVPEETWQQKYRTLKGMYDADVPRLHAQVKELTQRLDALQQAAYAQPPEQPKAQPAQLVTDDDVQAFGADLIEVQRKVAREVASEFKADIDALRAENAKLREQLSGTDHRVLEASFEQRLHRAIPDFEVINSDPRWIAWLDEIDPILRGPRKIVAQDAFSKGDVDGVAHYVAMFKSSVAPAEQTPTARSRAAEAERQIQPSRSATSATQPAPTGRVYSNDEITRMFKRAADMSAQGRHDEARKLEAEIDAAFMENRVTV